MADQSVNPMAVITGMIALFLVLYTENGLWFWGWLVACVVMEIASALKR